MIIRILAKLLQVSKILRGLNTFGNLRELKALNDKGVCFTTGLFRFFKADSLQVFSEVQKRRIISTSDGCPQMGLLRPSF